MKRLFLIVFTLLLASFHAKAQDTEEKIVVTGITVARTGDEVLVTFQARTKKNVVKSNYSYLFSPVITNGEYRVSLPAVIVRGKRAEIIQNRKQIFSEQPAGYSNFQVIRPGMQIDYFAAVPFQQWMEGAAMFMESRSWGCCSSENYPDKCLAEYILPPPPPVVKEVEPEPEVKPTQKSIGDSLALNFTFIFPNSQWDESNTIYNEDRERALIVYYRAGRSAIELDFRDNRMTLTILLAIINIILESNNSEVSRIVVAGFSSPEGPFAFNDKLAWERAVSIKEYIMKNTVVKSSNIILYNGSEDWRGLRALVAASNLHDKAEVLRIIDSVPIVSPDGKQKERLQQLKELNGGVSYRYIEENFYPLLRNGAYIRVYYDNK